jgi:hypothetical protein
MAAPPRADEPCAGLPHRCRPGRRAGRGGPVLIVIAAPIVGTRLLAPSSGPTQTGPAQTGPTGRAGVIGTFGIATTTSHCPAASVPGAGARCPKSPECWDGLVKTEGVITASSLPCTGPHTWQTFSAPG